MVNVFVFNQNLKLDSLKKFSNLINTSNKNIFVTTHYLFENEREYLNSLFDNIEYYTFADFLTDAEMANIDENAFTSKNMCYEEYLSNIKVAKNRTVINKIMSKFDVDEKYILCNNLGIDEDVWKKAGFKSISGEYYYQYEKKTIRQIIKERLKNIKVVNWLYHMIKGKSVKNQYMHIPEEVSVAYYEGHKYVFIGSMNRIAYRFKLNFIPSEEECEKLNNRQYEEKDKCTYVTTWHEHTKCDIPDDFKYDVRWTQDGYLPPNYSHKDYFFKPDNVIYYCWDKLGTKLFENQGLPYEIIPFRNKIFLPEINFPSTLKNILIVASGSGDWTALKNRSDDDIMVDAIAKMAKKFPEINFTYRCHPTWVHPNNVGINSINRVRDYFDWLKLDNLKLSSNIPVMKKDNKYQYSFPRTSLNEDLANTDLVIGEHSISMIDAAFKNIPFFSVNLTKRRNFFIGINELGFPSCTNIEDIENMIKNATKQEFKKDFLDAVKNYNEMTEI